VIGVPLHCNYREVVADPKECPFVSRAGLKLDHSLREFSFDVKGFVCADFGCNVGGFTDCLLQRGVAKVYAIDTGYGVLAWKLRNDPRVVVMERTNALHVEAPSIQSDQDGDSSNEGRAKPQAARGVVDLVVIDMAWTPQRHAIPAALKWLKPAGRIITLIKPHYELAVEERKSLLIDGRLAPEEADRVMLRVLAEMQSWGGRAIAHTRSPITGGKSSKGGEGNVEFLALVEPIA